MRPKDIENKIILVAGAAGGIGLATCKYLAERGAIVVAASRTVERRSGYAAMHIAADLSTIAGWRMVIDTTIAEYRHIDVLVNCVGTLVPGRFESLPDDDIDLLIKGNISSTVYAMKAIVPVMRQQGRGHIVTVGSIGGIIPMPFESLYSASKFAVRGLCLSLRKELEGTGVDVSLLSPGPVQTRMLDREALDDQSYMTFATSILKPEAVAREVFNVILNPKDEVILPKRLASLARFVGSSSRLFSALLPLLRSWGRTRLYAYRKIRLLPLPNLEAIES
jgi:short-subunit dehydrogenase